MTCFLKLWLQVMKNGSFMTMFNAKASYWQGGISTAYLKGGCKCKSLRFNRYSFLDWTLTPAPVASGWKVQEELPAWTPAGTNSVFFKLTGMRDWRFFSFWITSKAKRVFMLENVCILRWTCAQIKIYMFISTRLVSLSGASWKKNYGVYNRITIVLLILNF